MRCIVGVVGVGGVVIVGGVGVPGVCVVHVVGITSVVSVFSAVLNVDEMLLIL